QRCFSSSISLYRDGFARFSGARFSLGSICDQYAHLTNVAVQCTAPDYDPERGCKWQLQQLRRYLTGQVSGQRPWDSMTNHWHGTF
ncbi:hypothetical protein AAFF_G00191570, partial [Aldrovandia affinis]